MTKKTQTQTTEKGDFLFTKQVCKKIIKKLKFTYSSSHIF